MEYFIVTAMCGHVGKGRYVEKAFPIIASSRKDAAAKCREIPRVKHENKRAILDVRQVCYDEFIAQRLKNDSDPYLQAKNKRDYFAAGLFYEDSKDMSEIDGAVSKAWSDRDENSKKLSHKAYKNHYCDTMSREEILYEISYAM